MNRQQAESTYSIAMTCLLVQCFSSPERKADTLCARAMSAATHRPPSTHGRRGCSPQRAGDAPTPIRASSPACLRSAASILQSSCTCCQVGAWFEQPRGHREHAVDYCIHRHHKSASYRSMMLALQSMQHRVPIGGVSSSARVPRARRRDQAAPLGRSWLGWGLCLERRAYAAHAGPADPDLVDRAS